MGLPIGILIQPVLLLPDGFTGVDCASELCDCNLNIIFCCWTGLFGTYIFSTQAYCNSPKASHFTLLSLKNKSDQDTAFDKFISEVAIK